MTDDPEITQLNIQHYKHLLTLFSGRDTRNQVIRLLGEAEAQLSASMTEDKASPSR